MSPVQLLLRPSHGSKLFVVFLFSRGFCHLGPKMPQNPWENKKKRFAQCRLSSFSSDPLHGSKLFSFSRFLQLCQSNNISRTISVAHFLCFLVFLFLGLLGEIFTLTNIHWHSFHPSTFYTDFFIELLMLATEPSETIYSKNSFITHLFRHSIGLMFYWYAEVLAPHI